jgi:hypothetical protein
MTLPNTTSINYKINHDGIFSYVEPITTVAVPPYRVPVQLTANQQGYVCNLPTLLPALTPGNCVLLTIADITLSGNSSGFWVRADAAGAVLTGFNIRANAVFSACIDTLPILYLDNISTANVLDLDIYVSGS